MVLEKIFESLRLQRRSNQLILKEISPEYSLERLMLKLKLQYFGHLIWRADSLEKTLGGQVLRWRRNRMGRPLSLPQTHQKNIWTLSKFHKTTSECQQRTSGTQKSSPLSLEGDVLSVVLYRWRSLEATVKIRLKTRSRRIKSKFWEHQRTPDSREH